MHFHFQRSDYDLQENHVEAANGILRESSQGFSFNDMAFYETLMADADCVRVDLVRIRCRHNNFVSGLQAVYRSTFRHGRTALTEAPSHFFDRGFYSYHGGSMEVGTLDLEDGEFLVGVGTREGEILDAVHFVTNRRRVHFGGFGGTLHQFPNSDYTGAATNTIEGRERGTQYIGGAHPNPSERIVAFAGTERGVMQRIGYYTEKIGWTIVGPIVMLRWLKEQQRAQHSLDEQCSKDDLVVRALVDCQDEIFRSVLLFLI